MDRTQSLTGLQEAFVLPANLKRVFIFLYAEFIQRYIMLFLLLDILFDGITFPL